VPDVDLHCHLLPGVDDGPDTMDESVAYARDAAARGTQQIVATPHVELVDVGELSDRVEELRAALSAAGVELAVEVGGELKPESVARLDAQALETIAHGPPGARWLLYEVPFSGVGDAFLAGAAELRERGYALLLAHPERSRGLLAGGLHALGGELRAGARLACNIGPLVGAEGPEREEALTHLLEHDLVHLLATDAHPPRRPYTLDLARGVVKDGRLPALTGERAARALAQGLPRP
jgi:protein-tyrosine phosphatase